MRIIDELCSVIGQTPLIKLDRFSENFGGSLFAKLEMMNPTGSIKDRTALFIIKGLLESGLLNKHSTIIESTSGNTGISLAMIASRLGCKSIFTIPDKMSLEKVKLLKSYGAKVLVTPTNVTPDSKDSCFSIARELSTKIPGSFYTNQFNNPQNIYAHYRTTGPEIWEQTKGTVDILVAGIGTGGSITGIAKFLKEKKPNIKVIGVDPIGSVYHSIFYGVRSESIHPYLVEGIGEDFLGNSLVLDLIDEIIPVSDKDSFLTARLLSKKEGILAGGSSGSALWVALGLPVKTIEKKNIVVLFPDSGDRYLSKIYNDDWMKQNGFLQEENVTNIKQ